VVRGSTGGLISGRRGRGHVAAPEPPSAGMRGPELRNTWQRRSSPLKETEPGAMGHVTVPEELRNARRRRSLTQQGGEVRGRGTYGSSGAHLCREVWSEVTAYVAAHGCTTCSLS
jgi:hypothetical protein